jgi:two-component system CheB/CheR fusion protein
VLVDETHKVLHLSDNAGRFLMPSGGPLSGDIADLARPELRFELRSSLHRVFETDLPVLTLPISVQFNGSAARRVQLLAKPTREEGSPRRAVVLFIEGDAVAESEVAGDAGGNAEVVSQLRQELELTQSRLKTVREESDAANEELRAANEELQSINEEYRSTSEELETSKEELQSINEELQTVNSELKLKLDAVSRAHGDLQNLLSATDLATLFLDSNLRIKRFTPRTTELFSLTASDEGRSITDFSNQLEYDELEADARKVLTDLSVVIRQIKSRRDRWYDVKLRPYRTVDDKIDGVIITFSDITECRELEEALADCQKQLAEAQ